MGDSAISVAVRCRPLLKNEDAAADPMSFHNGTVVRMQSKSFPFDFVFPPNVTNEAVYNLAVAEKIHHIFEGYNLTILAYGPTGSGKTYTMGTDYNPKKDCNSDIGIIPQGLREIFRVLESEKDKKSFSVKVSFLELYRETVYDLLHPAVQSCTILEEKDGNFKVYNLTEVPVNCIEDAFVILTKGSNIRHTSATAKNAKSSRSHAIFSVYVEQIDRTTLDTKRAKFQLVDLAGSERMSVSKTAGLQLKEGIKINLSLHILGKVITALTDDKQHIPYRESKLTRLLKDSLGGNSHTVMIACVNPSSTSVEETLSTLRYASNTRKIKNRPVVNVDPPAVQIEKLKKQVESLEAALYKMQPSNPVESTDSPNSDGKALQLLQAAYSRISTLNQRLIELEEKDFFINGKLKSFYESVKLIVTDMVTAAAADSELKIHLEKLKEIQSECLQLVIQGNMIRGMEDPQNSSQSSETAEDYESCESVLPIDMETESPDSSEEPLSPIKSEEQLMEELNGIAEQQKSSTKLLDDVQRALDMKEEMARHMQVMLENYGTADEKHVDVLVNQIQSLVKEKTNLEEEMKKEKKYLQENHDKIEKYETEIKNLQNDLRLVNKRLQMKVESKAKVDILQKEIQNLKKYKVQVVKQMKENTNKHMRIQRQKDKDIAKLERESRKKDFEFSKMKTKFSNQVRVLETKVSQATVSKKALLQALQKKKPRQTGVKPLQSQAALEEWIEEELKISVCNSLVKVQLETLEKDADILKEQIRKIEQLSPSLEDGTNLPTDEEQLKAELQIQLEQIADMRKQNKEVDQRAKSCIILDGITNLSEAHPVIEYLYNKCATSEVEAAKQLQMSEENLKKQQAINESSEEKIKNLSNEVKSLKDELSKFKLEQEMETSALKWQHESKMLQLMAEVQSLTRSSLSETTDPNLIKRLDMQELEIQKMQTLREKYDQKCVEIEKLNQELFKVKKGKRSKWLCNLSNYPDKSITLEENKSESMIAEYLSSGEEESFSYDQNDPDWRLTPLHKRQKLEKKALMPTTLKMMDSEPNESSATVNISDTDSVSSLKPFLPCPCEGSCKTMRCKCRKRNVKCSSACSCSLNKCLNLPDPNI